MLSRLARFLQSGARSGAVLLLCAVPTLLDPAPVAAQRVGGSDARPLSQRIRIDVEHGSEAEMATRDQLRRVLDRYDVGRWIWTDRVRIDETEIPHSHPVLTLHTRALGDEVDQLSTFLHEQFHWGVAEREEAEEAAIAELRSVFPEVPAGAPEGARDTYSTYLHLIVCDLEYQALAGLVGDEAARELLSESGHYTWIYQTVLNDPRVREITLGHGFDAETLRPRTPGPGG